MLLVIITVRKSLYVLEKELQKANQKRVQS